MYACACMLTCVRANLQAFVFEYAFFRECVHENGCELVHACVRVCVCARVSASACECS